MTSPNTELDELRSDIQTLLKSQADLAANLARLIESHNQVGENLQWLVANVQGLFQVFNNPDTMSKLMGQMMGGGMMNHG